MVRPIPTHPCNHFTSVPLAIGLFLSISALITLCAKHTHRRVTKTHMTQSKTRTDPKMGPNSPLPSPKQLITTIGNKAMPFRHQKKGEAEKEKEGFGEGGLWQKEILMGEKCQPPEFSGVIYYDPFGNQISEMPPRSPRASPLRVFPGPVANHHAK